MTKLPIGLQLYSIRDDMEKDFFGTLEKVKEMGYEAVEFAGIFDKDPLDIKAKCDELGLVPISAHVAMPVFLSDIEGVVKAYSDIGCKFLAIPWASPETDLPGGTNYDEFLENVKKVSAVAKKYGIVLCYHNHDFEFEKIDSVYKIDKLYSDTTPDELQTQLDTCWVKVGGEDPANFVKKYAGRAPTVHIKDFFGEKNAKMYELIDGGKVEDNGEEVKPFELRPVGYGVQDVASIIKAAEEAGASYIIIEQDNPSMDKTPLECVKMSIDYVRNL